MRSKIVQIGKVKIGGGNPIAIQSMLNCAPTDFARSARQIRELKSAGCQIFRITVPSFDALATFARLKKEFPDLPFVADLHFAGELAVSVHGR